MIQEIERDRLLLKRNLAELEQELQNTHARIYLAEERLALLRDLLINCSDPGAASSD